VFIDIEMPMMDGITAIHNISEYFPKNKILVFGSDENEEYSATRKARGIPPPLKKGGGQKAKVRFP